jgi:hypothetical protein
MTKTILRTDKIVLAICNNSHLFNSAGTALTGMECCRKERFTGKK